MGEGPLWAVVGAALTGLFAFLVQKLRGQTDETVAVLGQWQELLDAHKASSNAEIAALKARLSEVEKELAQVRNQASIDMAALRKQHATEMDEMRKRHRLEMRQLRELNDGLQRMIAQNSKSTAQLMGDSPATNSLRRAYDEGEGEGEGDGAGADK